RRWDRLLRLWRVGLVVFAHQCIADGQQQSEPPGRGLDLLLHFVDGQRIQFCELHDNTPLDRSSAASRAAAGLESSTPAIATAARLRTSEGVSTLVTFTSPRSHASSSSAVCPASSQSETSPFGGSPGSSTIRTSSATAFTAVAISLACFRPGSSLSGRITTRRPASDSVYCGCHLPAPPGHVVAATF